MNGGFQIENHYKKPFWGLSILYQKFSFNDFPPFIKWEWVKICITKKYIFELFLVTQITINFEFRVVPSIFQLKTLSHHASNAAAKKLDFT